MKYSFHPAAEQDVADASDYYVAKAGPLVAERFLEELNRAALLLVEFPGLGTPNSKGNRKFPLRAFPYSLVYRHLEGRIQILVVQHQHRKPGYGSNRQ